MEPKKAWTWRLGVWNVAGFLFTKEVYIYIYIDFVLLPATVSRQLSLILNKACNLTITIRGPGQRDIPWVRPITCNSR